MSYHNTNGPNKKNTVMRDVVNIEERLFTTLGFLAIGKNYEN